MTDIEAAARATRRYWPAPHYDMHMDQVMYGVFGWGGIDVPEMVLGSMGTLKEAQAACDRMNLQAVLEAIREPNDAMISASYNVSAYGYIVDRSKFKAMIGALIEEIKK